MWAARLVITFSIGLGAMLNLRAAETNEFRQVNGQTFNLKLLKEWLAADPRIRTQRRPLESWDKLSALRFLANHKEGVVCEVFFTRDQVLRGPYAKLKTPQEIARSGMRLEVLIKNFPQLDQLESKGTYPPIFAFNCGVLNTVQLNGNSVRVWVWDYGLVPKAGKEK